MLSNIWNESEMKSLLPWPHAALRQLSTEVKSRTAGASWPWFESHLYYYLLMGPWANCITFLRFSLPICKIGMITI